MALPNRKYRNVSNPNKDRARATHKVKGTSYDIDQADKNCRKLVNTFEQQTNFGDAKAHLTLRNMRLKHPLFSKLSITGFKFLMENSSLFKLKPGQFIYRQGIVSAPNLYFIMYGSFTCQNSDVGGFGSIMCIGHTLGEEILFG